MLALSLAPVGAACGLLLGSLSSSAVSLTDPARLAETVRVEVRLEGGNPVPGGVLYLDGTAPDGGRHRWSAQTDEAGAAVVDIGAGTCRSARFRWPSGSRFEGVSFPSREIPEGATTLEIVLDAFWLQVDPGALGDWEPSEATFALSEVTENRLLGGSSGVPCARSSWGSAFAPAGKRYLALLGRPGERPRAALIDAGAAHGIVKPRLESRPAELATFQLAVSGAIPAAGALVRVDLTPAGRATEPQDEPRCMMRAEARVGAGGGYGVALPGSYSVRASVIGEIGHPMVVLARGQTNAMVDLKASEDSRINVHLQPAGGVEFTLRAKKEKELSFKFEDMSVEVRRDVATGSGANWKRVSVREIRRNGEWREPRQLRLGERFALEHSLPAGDHELRVVALGVPSMPVKVSVANGAVSLVEVTW
ncbi:MAG: hypothetical protein AAGG01_04815 [Planctomycetota bacterium]